MRKILLAMALLAALNARADIIAYDNVLQAGNQAWSGPLGMDFDVLQPITITELGAFDSNGDGFVNPIRVSLYDRTAIAAPLVSILIGPGFGGVIVNGSRFVDIADIPLSGGFEGSIVAEGYGPADLNGNLGISSPPFAASTTNGGGGAIAFVGSSRFGATPGTYPSILDSGPANRYGAGTFQFDVLPTALPEPAGLPVTALILAAAFGMARRRG